MDIVGTLAGPCQQRGPGHRPAGFLGDDGKPGVIWLGADSRLEHPGPGIAQYAGQRADLVEGGQAARHRLASEAEMERRRR